MTTWTLSSGKRSLWLGQPGLQGTFLVTIYLPSIRLGALETEQIKQKTGKESALVPISFFWKVRFMKLFEFSTTIIHHHVTSI
jgi:hypothetical protein